MEQLDLQITPVFQALSQPATLLGVDYDYFLVESIVVLLLFIGVNQFSVCLLLIPLHLVGWLLARFDPHAMRLLSVRATIGMTKNKTLWGVQSYEAS